MLRGMGVSLALPLLDAMTPAFAAPRQTRLPHAGELCPERHGHERLAARATGADSRCRAFLQPMEPHRKQMLVIEGLAQHNGWPNGDGTGIMPARLPLISPAYNRRPAVPILPPGFRWTRSLPSNWARARAFLRSNSPAKTDAWLGFAIPATAACTAITSRGARLRHRAHPRSIRAPCLRRCSARKIPTRRCARSRAGATPASSIGSSGKPTPRNQLGPADRDKLDEYLTSVREIEVRIQNAEQRCRCARQSKSRPRFRRS